jgi:hypothetical protein
VRAAHQKAEVLAVERWWPQGLWMVLYGGGTVARVPSNTKLWCDIGPPANVDVFSFFIFYD